MPPFVQWWCDMAKEKSNQAAAENLNAEDTTDDLNAEGVVSAAKVGDGDASVAANKVSGPPDDDPDAEEDNSDAEEEVPEFVVLKGNSIRHDGEVYRENSAIPVTGKDAERLLQAGVIADVSVLRQRAMSAQPSVSVTSE